MDLIRRLLRTGFPRAAANPPDGKFVCVDQGIILRFDDKELKISKLGFIARETLDEATITSRDASI